MERTYEIRWIFEEPQQNLIRWFDRLDTKFKGYEIQIDQYMDLKKHDISIKDREGNLEIKKRANRPRSVNEIYGMYGYLEEWYKWSYKTESTESKDVQNGKKSCKWLSVNKTRLLTVLTEKNGKLKFLPKGEQANNGCQIEYTKFKIDGGKLYYTFCLEWFGNQIIKLNETLINDLVANNKYCLQDSEGYASFLKSKTQEYYPSDVTVLSLIS